MQYVELPSAAILNVDSSLMNSTRDSWSFSEIIEMCVPITTYTNIINRIRDIISSIALLRHYIVEIVKADLTISI